MTIRTLNIGLFGGTFDPIHNGHLIIAEYLRDELALDEVWFIPASIHPFKDNKGITAASHRLKMLELATRENKRFRVNDIELRKEGVSYTIDTLNELIRLHQQDKSRFHFFMGMDNVNDLNAWKNPFEILQKCTVIAFGRPGFKPDEAVKELAAQIRFVHVPLLEISSTFVRERVRTGHSVRYIIPEIVEAYIYKNQLYK